MGYGLGVDLGTTYSAAAISRGGSVETFTLGTTAPAIPSVVVLRSDGEVLVGEVAERRSVTEPARTGREFKRRLGDPTPLILGGTPYGAEALMAHLLTSIVTQVTEREGEPPARVVLTHPANYGPYKKDLMLEAARLAGLDLEVVSLLTEPEAAAISYAGQQRVEPGQIVAIYDFGGGTFDAALVRKTDTGFELVGTPEGMERLGGIDIDAGVLAHVNQSLDGILSELDSADQSTRAGLARLRDESRQAKEALSTDTDTAISVSVPGVQTEVRLTRAELETMIRPRIAETLKALTRAVSSAGLTMNDVSRVLLVGGSSRIPLVGQMVREATGRPVALDAHPKFAIAQGAAKVAAEALVAPAPIAPAVSPTVVVPAVPPPEPVKRRGAGPLLIGGLVVAAAAVGFFLFGRGNEANPTTTTEVAAQTTTGPATTVAIATTQAAATTTGGATTTASSAAVDGGGTVVLVAGTDNSPNPTAGEDGPADQAALNSAEDIAVAPNGDIYIADFNSARLLKISDGNLTIAHRGDFNAGENDFTGVDVAPDGTVYFASGNGIRSLSPDGTLGAVTEGDGGGSQVYAFKVAVAPDGSLFVANGRAPRIDLVSPDGTSVPIAGNGSVASTIVGDGGPATDAMFSRISDIAVDSAGNLYVADENLNAVRKIDADGTISTVFGAGTIRWQEAVDGTPAADVLGGGAGEIGVAVDAADRLYIVLRLAAKVWRVEDGNLVTVAGGGTRAGTGGQALETQISAPSRLAFEPNGDMLIVVLDGLKVYRIEGVGS